MGQPERTEAAYQHCLALARSHYENFPVASHVLPARLRRPVAAIYAFARHADDLADEGDHPPAWRLEQLAAWRDQLNASAAGQPPGEQPIFIALADTIARHRLPIEPFHHLLDAFTQDVTTTRYPDWATTLDYCARSANPVGHLLLHLYDAASAENLERSDALCTALQWINFLQDIGQDLDENDRLYLPLDRMAHHGVTLEQLRARHSTPALQTLIAELATHTAALLDHGAPLARALKGRAGLELRLIVSGAGHVLDALRAPRDDLFNRPRLTPLDYAKVATRALFRFPTHPTQRG